MKRLAIAVAAPLLALALLLAACDDGGAPSESAPTRTPPADPAARFQELEELRKAASFHVIYDRDPGSPAYEGLEFAWLQDEKRVRWVTSSILEGTLAGSSSIDDGTASGLTCGWVTLDDHESAEIVCDPVPRGVGLGIFDQWLNGPSSFGFQEDVEFGGYETILNVEVECFTAIVRLTNDGRTMCYTSQGIPLAIVSNVRFGGTGMGVVLMAKEIRPPPSEEDLLTPIIADAPLGQEVTLREIPLDDLVLPSLPIIEDFFSEAEE